MLAPPTDRLHKFLAIAGIVLFIVGVTVPLDRYDQAVRQFIEAKAKTLEVGNVQLRLSKVLDAYHARQKQLEAESSANKNAAVASERAQFEADVVKLQREIADLSVQARKQFDLAEHAERARTLWLVLGAFCVVGGLAIATVGFVMWWRQPADLR